MAETGYPTMQEFHLSHDATVWKGVPVSSRPYKICIGQFLPVPHRCVNVFVWQLERLLTFPPLLFSHSLREFHSLRLYVTVLQQKYVKIFIEEPQFPAPGAITLWSFRFSRTTTWKITEVMQGYNIMILPSKAQKHPSHFSESVGFHGELVALRPKPKLNFAVY